MRLAHARRTAEYHVLAPLQEPQLVQARHPGPLHAGLHAEFEVVQRFRVWQPRGIMLQPQHLHSLAISIFSTESH